MRTTTAPSGPDGGRAPYQSPPAALASDHTARSTPARARVPSVSSQKAGSMTSMAPIAKPNGIVTSMRVRTPGETSAPSGWRSASGSSGRQAREASDDVNATVPTMTRTAERPSAAAGDSSPVAIAVSSGPTTKMSSTTTESRAKAVGSRSGSRRSGHSERIAVPSGGIPRPTQSAAATSAASGASAEPERDEHDLGDAVEERERGRAPAAGRTGR